MKSKMLAHFFVLLLIAATAFGAVFGIHYSCNWQQNEHEQALSYSFSELTRVTGRKVLIDAEESMKYFLVNLEEPFNNSIASKEAFYYDYVGLALYRKGSGNSVSVDQILDYMSNGNRNHPVAVYIRWAEKNTEARFAYRTRLREIYYEYAGEREGFPLCLPYLLPIEMVDELIMKEADTNYLLDLTSIQNRYITESRAELSLDGKTIRFYMPYYH